MKPFAYAVVQGEDDRENISLQFDHPEMCGQKYRQAIPLFTHPVELTDEEIEEVIRKHWNREYKNRSMLEFAKAILRKAGEK